MSAADAVDGEPVAGEPGQARGDGEVAAGLALAAQAEAEGRAGELGAAWRALHEAERLLIKTRLGPDSELGRAIDRARALLQRTFV